MAVTPRTRTKNAALRRENSKVLVANATDFATVQLAPSGEVSTRYPFSNLPVSPLGGTQAIVALVGVRTKVWTTGAAAIG